MAILRVINKCNNCKSQLASYFLFDKCGVCGSLDVTKEDISLLKISSFSNEGRKLTIRKEVKTDE